MITSLFLPLFWYSLVTGSVLSQRQSNSSVVPSPSSPQSRYNGPMFKSEQEVEAYLDENYRTHYIDYLYAVPTEDRKRPSNEKVVGDALSSCAIPNSGILGGMTTILCHLEDDSSGGPYPVTFRDGQYWQKINQWRRSVYNEGADSTYPPPATRDGIPLSAKDFEMPQFNGTVTSAVAHYKKEGLPFTVNIFILGFLSNNYGFDSEGYMYQWEDPLLTTTSYDFFDCPIPEKHGLKDFRAVLSRRWNWDGVEEEPLFDNCTKTGIRSMASAKMVLPKPPPVKQNQ